MENFSGQIFNLLITPPGNLVYHLILAFSIVSSLQAALVARRGGDGARAGRMYLGLSILLFAQIALFASSGLAWQQIVDPQRLLPVLDRVAIALMLVWLVWLWCFPAPNRVADAAAALVTIVLGVVSMFSVNLWLQEPATLNFNGSLYDQGWQIFSVVVILVGILALLISRPPAWGAGLAAFGLLLAGYVANLLLNPAGDFSGILRLSHLCAFPLLPVLAQRLTAAPTLPPVIAPAASDTARAVYDPRSGEIWLHLAAESDPHKTANLLCQAVAQLYKADLAFVVTSPNGLGHWQLLGGYDLINCETLEDLSLDAARVPDLTGTLQRGRAIRIESGPKAPADLLAVANFLGMDDPGSLLATPLISAGLVWGGLVLFAPYSHPNWTDAERDLLAGSADTLMGVLLRHKTSPFAAESNGSLERELQEARQQIETLRRAAAVAPGAGAEVNADVSALLALQKATEEKNAQLEAENTRLSSARPSLLSADTVKDEYLDGQLKMALEETAHYSNQLAEANMRILELERGASLADLGANGQDWITAVTQDLRQPLTAVSGYVDLLLGDPSAGLNHGQRSYLERVKAAAERLRATVDDLLRVVSLAAGSLQLSREPVDLSSIISQAVSANSALLREKSLILDTNFDDDLPEIPANPEGLRQVITNLLRSAAASSPPGSTIGLSLGRDEPGSACIEISDSGGGIPEEQLEHIFEMRYQAGASQIEGTGEAGFGLPVAQALAQAQGGLIRVSSQPGRGSIYTLRLPLDGHPTSAAEAL